MSQEKELKKIYQIIYNINKMIMPKLESNSQNLKILPSTTIDNIIQNILILSTKIYESVQIIKNNKYIEEYQQLEKILQTQEAEIRNHIRIQQQMKLYSQSLQCKLQTSEKIKAQIQQQLKQLKKNTCQPKQRDSNINNITKLMYGSNKPKKTRFDTEVARTTPMKSINNTFIVLKQNQDKSKSKQNKTQKNIKQGIGKYSTIGSHKVIQANYKKS